MREMGVLQLINIVREDSQGGATQDSTAHHELFFIETFFGPTKILAMVDTRSMHNYISAKKVRGLGLKMTNGNHSLKVVNSPAPKCVGDVLDASMWVGSWLSSMNLVAIDMVDFNMILGQEFIR